MAAPYSKRTLLFCFTWQLTEFSIKIHFYCSSNKDGVHETVTSSFVMHTNIYIQTLNFVIKKVIVNFCHKYSKPINILLFQKSKRLLLLGFNSGFVYSWHIWYCAEVHPNQILDSYRIHIVFKNSNRDIER